MVDRSQQNWRQLAVRARRHLEAPPRFEADRRRQRELAERFLAASSAGDLDGLIGLLARDVVVLQRRRWQGGGRPAAHLRRRPVAAFLARVAPRGWRAGYQTRFVEVNGQPGFLIGQDARSPCSCSASPKGWCSRRFVWNPDGLRHLLRRERP